MIDAAICGAIAAGRLIPCYKNFLLVSTTGLLHIRKGCNERIHVAQVKEDDQRNQNTNSWAPNGRSQYQENHQNAPPWCDIQICQLLAILFFKESTVLHNDNCCKEDNNGTKDTIRIILKRQERRPRFHLYYNISNTLHLIFNGRCRDTVCGDLSGVLTKDLFHKPFLSTIHSLLGDTTSSVKSFQRAIDTRSTLEDQYKC